MTPARRRIRGRHHEHVHGSRQARDSHPDWRHDAACREADPELFFPDDTRPVRAQVKAAKLICRGCPVSATCLSWALASGQQAGIWGGLTEDERRGLHRRGRPGWTTPFPYGREPRAS